jgi:hypothetical protein
MGAHRHLCNILSILFIKKVPQIVDNLSLFGDQHVCHKWGSSITSCSPLAVNVCECRSRIDVELYDYYAPPL